MRNWIGWLNVSLFKIVTSQCQRHTTGPCIGFKKYVTPAAHEALQRISSTARPKKYTLALIKPRITPAAHEALQRVSSATRPQNDTLVLLEPRIASAHTLDGIPQDKIWQSLIVARTVTHWCSKTNSALVQIGNPSDRSIILKPNTIVGTISPVTAISPRTASAIIHNHSESSQARIDLTAGLDEWIKIQHSLISRKHSY